MYDLDSPEGRLRAAEALGPDGYNAAMAAKRAASIIETVNGQPIRTVNGGRWGRLFQVGNGSAFATLEQARAHARGGV
jgi:hypothetical protein